ncbi:unnamed protein product, partial [marine sediment metagenome]
RHAKLQFATRLRQIGTSHKIGSIEGTDGLLWTIGASVTVELEGPAFGSHSTLFELVQRTADTFHEGDELVFVEPLKTYIKKVNKTTYTFSVKQKYMKQPDA